jgi:hypothetical protein
MSLKPSPTVVSTAHVGKKNAVLAEGVRGVGIKSKIVKKESSGGLLFLGGHLFFGKGAVLVLVHLAETFFSFGGVLLGTRGSQKLFLGNGSVSVLVEFLEHFLRVQGSLLLAGVLGVHANGGDGKQRGWW